MYFIVNLSINTTTIMMYFHCYFVRPRKIISFYHCDPSTKNILISKIGKFLSNILSIFFRSLIFFYPKPILYLLFFHISLTHYKKQQIYRRTIPSAIPIFSLVNWVSTEYSIGKLHVGNLF